MADDALTDATHWSAYWQDKRPERIEVGWHYADLLRRVTGGHEFEALAASGKFASLEAFYHGPFCTWLEPGAPRTVRPAVDGGRVVGLALDAARPRTRLTGRDVVAVGRKT